MIIGISFFSAVLSKCFLFCIVVWLISSVSCGQNRNTALFRDNLLPFLGGKIPDSAFLPERLYTNRLNKNGIYTLDGVYFQERHPERHHFPRAFMPNTIKVKIPIDNKHVAKPGRIFKPDIIDTTYLISETVPDTLNPPYVNFKDFPLIPIHSLKLASTAKMKKIIPNYESLQIFQNYIPLLKKMHEVYKRK